MTSEQIDNNVAQFDDAKKEKEGGGGFTKIDDGFLQRLRDVKERVASKVAERKSLNDDIASEMASLQSDGLNPKAFKAACAYLDMSPEQRENYDLSYAVSRRALGEPLQDDLFVATAKQNLKKAVQQ